MEFQVVKATRALRDAFRHPERVLLDTELRVLAMFAVAMLVVVTVNTITAMIAQQQTGLTEQLQNVLPKTADNPDQPLLNRAFTAHLGGALMVSMGSTVALAALLMILVRFMLDVPSTFSQALIAASAAAGIGALGTCILVLAQVSFGTIQAGPHLGWLVSPQESPQLFAWLQRVNVFTAWEHIAAASALVAVQGYHTKYGVVVGVTSWVVTLVVFAGLAMLAWILAGAT
jgi:hypothetical protein